MSYCRYCGTEITYKRTKNEKWMPCNLLTGEPHFCQETSSPQKSGVTPCKLCGKPLLACTMAEKAIDYATLEIHTCKKGDITRYQKFKKRSSKK